MTLCSWAKKKKENQKSKKNGSNFAQTKGIGKMRLQARRQIHWWTRLSSPFFPHVRWVMRWTWYVGYSGLHGLTRK